jgi:cob(I)alamin adenosyltransferase
MANRLTIITTRTGDNGTSALADGARLSKASAAFAALGDVDELNSVIGVAVAGGLPSRLTALVAQIQNDLFDVGAELAWPGHDSVTEEQIAFLDKSIVQLNADLPPLKEFVLPGGALSSAQLQHARAVCRRAERAVAFWAEQSTVAPSVLQYLNRLSDLLFIAARTCNKLAAVAEPTWKKRIR